jgi:hypothetical protein
VTYFKATMSTTAQNTIDKTPSTVASTERPPAAFQRLTEGVNGTGADVAEHHA